MVVPLVRPDRRTGHEPECLDEIGEDKGLVDRVARLNGRGFLVNASIGLYARLLSERESFTRRFGRNRAVATLAAAASALRSHRTFELLLRERGTERRTSATTLIVGTNALQLELVEKAKS